MNALVAITSGGTALSQTATMKMSMLRAGDKVW